METKTCSRCCNTFPIEQFSKAKGNKDSLSNSCKACQKQYRLDNKERQKVYFSVYYQNNKEKKDKQSSDYVNRNRDKINTYSRDYAKTIRHKRNAYAMKRYAQGKNCTPPWLNKEQLSQIENFYWLATDLRVITGQEYHVDHIVPIQGKNVCGLHVPWNLQVLPSDINIAKSNKFNGW